MTVFDFFKRQLDDAIAEGCGTTKICIIDPSIKKDSFRWLAAAADHFWGGEWWFNMKDVTDIREMKELGYIKYIDYSNWMARQTGKTRKIALTNKGLRAFYNEMIKGK